MTEDQTFAESHAVTAPRKGTSRGFFGWLLDELSGFKLCVFLLTALFVYSSIGSAGMLYPTSLNVLSADNWVHMYPRQLPMFEMTEFEWFHTWAFYGMCALLCINMAFATVRRIPFNLVRMGAWMIHGGIIIMTIGCVIYFGTKIEGDTPVFRRTVMVSVPGAPGATLPAIEGRRINVNTTEGQYAFQVVQVNPRWPMLTGESAGERVYSVSVEVTTPEQTFVRQMLAGYPELTEDIIPGQGRAVNAPGFGTKIVDPEVKLSLAYNPQDRFWIMHSSALHVRESGAASWNQRPVPKMPRYNNYLPSADEVFLPLRDEVRAEMVRTLDRPAVPEEGDTLPEVDLRVVGYLSYAEIQTEFIPGSGNDLNPVAQLMITSADGQGSDYELIAFDDARSVGPGGAVSFSWVESPALINAIKAGNHAVLTIDVPEFGASVEVPFRVGENGDPNGDFTPIEGTPHAYRVTSVMPRFPLGNGRTVAMAIVEFDTPTGRFARWVTDDPSISRDLDDAAHSPMGAGETRPMDERFVTTFAATRLTTVTLIAGPKETITPHVVVLNPSGSGTAIAKELEVGAPPVELFQDLSIAVTSLTERATRVTKPRVVPYHMRDKDLNSSRLMALALVEVEHEGQSQRAWVPYHRYSFDRSLYFGGSMGPYRPVMFPLADGRILEVIFSRESMPLPNPVVLNDFELVTRTGGFDGSTASIRDWASSLRFLQADATYSEVKEIKTNKPTGFGGLWFFQASWDPPRAPTNPDGTGGSMGLNHTGLGVGNREGMWTMLNGTILSVIGMMWAFYVKPFIKRRRRDAAIKLAEAKASDRGSGAVPETPLARTEKPEAAAGPRPSRGAFVAWFVLGVLVTLGISGLAVSSLMRSADGAPGTFAGEVDLTPLDRSAVYTSGRTKSFDSFANEINKYIAGPNRINDQAKDFTYIDMMLVPELYAERPTVYVKKKPIRQQIEMRARESLGMLSLEDRERIEGELDQFMETGLLSPGVFSLDPVRALLGNMRQDVVRTAKFVEAIDTSITLQQPETLARILRVIPPPSGSDQEQWLSIEDLFAEVLDQNTPGAAAIAQLDPELRRNLRNAFAALGQSWRDARLAQDPTSEQIDEVNRAIVQFANLLPLVSPELYPQTGTLERESWYFKLKGATWIWIVYLLAVLVLLMGVVYGWRGAYAMGMGLFYGSFTLHTVALAWRWEVSGRWPNSNMFEAVTTSVWLGTLCVILLEVFARKTPMRGLFALGAAGASMFAMMSAHYLPQLDPNIGNMMPILHDLWLYIHTNVIIASYALIAMGAVTGFLYLGWRSLGNTPDHATISGTDMLMRVAPGGTGLRKKASAGAVFDGATMIILELAFVLLWAGLVMGAIWADHSWGRPWGWDPKEVFALNTFLVYLVLIHVRLSSKDKGLWTALLAIVGCGVMLFNWIIVNFVISGLHSYA